jgi:hypothetical protein
MEALLGILIVASIYSMAKSFQLHAFSNFMAAKVYELYKDDVWLHADIDIERSYRNMTLAAPWNFKFEEMIVYAMR